MNHHAADPHQQLSRTALAKILQFERIEQISPHQLIEAFVAEPELAQFAPDGIYQIDPRDGTRIVYNSARARRPHDNQLAKSEERAADEECVVCRGQTTGVVDAAELSEGFTFINKNLFPVFYPERIDEEVAGLKEPGDSLAGPPGAPALGLHFLQWSSSLHTRDWHNMPAADRMVVMQRLAALEKKLLVDWPDAAPPGFPVTTTGSFVSIIKNYGRLVGGSLAHGHQQIAGSNVMPKGVKDNWQFELDRGESFSQFLLRENPEDLQVRDYGPAVLLVPYFMRRPYNMMLLLKDVRKRYLFELTETEMRAVVEGWHEAIRLMRWVLPELGRETAYNVITHTGPGAGLYFEFLPYTQETGGFEQLGLMICQATPQDNALQMRAFLESDRR